MLMMKRVYKSAVLVLLVGLVFSVSPVSAQEGFDDNFDNAELVGWEHSDGVNVEDGALQIESGNFAFRMGGWANVTLTIRLQYHGTGQVNVHYNASDQGTYILHFLPDILVLERVEQEVGQEMGSVSLDMLPQDEWFDLQITASEGQHHILINEQPLIETSDPEPLPPGAIGFVAEGETTASIDRVNLMPTEGAVPVPPEESPPAERVESVPPQAEAQAMNGNLLNQLFNIQASQVSISTFVINLLLAAVMAYILSRVYILWGSSLSNRRKFASNFMLITITTTFIILVVRSSIALSLGLVGALSIVRFRAAIKEPEELAYLFFAIGIGIGLGDNQRLITVVALICGILLIWIAHLLRQRNADINLHLTVASRAPNKVDLNAIMAVVQQHTAKAKLMRFDENGTELEAAFLIELRNTTQLQSIRASLLGLSPYTEITFLDNKGIW